MDFKNIPAKYRPIPFWSWNEKLDTKETSCQVNAMHSAGMGGFFMHARGGLMTDYMENDWFENVTYAKDSANKLDMKAWAYDENGWPSGFGNGIVNGLGVEYQQKYLRMSDTCPSENVIGKCGEHWFYYDINPFYVDTLDKKVISKFIEVAYKPYYDKYKNEIEGFFTDEPQISRCGIPWSFVLEKEYKEKYGENILEILEQLFLPVGNYKESRVKFWKLVTDLFSSAYMKQIYDACDSWGLKLTGHLVMEDFIYTQLTSNGACMPHYEYMHIPGMDWLGKQIYDCSTQLQVSSVAEQLGKDLVLSETYAACGHNITFSELKGLYEWQMVRGINLLCQHLEGYSLRGIRKRDYPPALFNQQPWWNEYKRFVDTVSRCGMLLSKGEKKVDVLLIHPQTTAWSMYSENDVDDLKELNRQFLNIIRSLEEKHIIFHLGDETIMERHGRVENGKLIIGKQSYSYVLNPLGEVLLPNTEELLSDFEKSGGKIVTVDELPANNIIDRSDITYQKRIFDNFTLHYFVNSSPDRKFANFNVSGRQLVLETGDLTDFHGVYEFEPWGSLMIIDDGIDYPKKSPESIDIVKPNGEFKILTRGENALTLDHCDYYFDGKLQEKNGYVLNITERANELGHSVKLHQDYHVKIACVPKSLYLVCETPEKFEITINGKTINKTVLGYFIDKSFKKIDIASYVKEGENTISFDCAFCQSDEFYENLKKAKIFESEKNKLAYDMEIEAIYLIGDFSVRTNGKWEKVESTYPKWRDVFDITRDLIRFRGEFMIDAPKSYVNVKNLEKQGFPFFAGELALSGEIDITGKNPVLCLDIKGINAVRVEINGNEKVMMFSERLPLKDFGVTGTTKVKITLVNNLRNLLGPHHQKNGQDYFTSPRSFFKEPCLWAASHDNWDDGYCFCETGI